MMGKLKKTAKSAYTYFYNWRSIMRFSSFGKGSFLGRRLTVNFSGGGVSQLDRTSASGRIQDLAYTMKRDAPPKSSYMITFMPVPTFLS